MDIFIYLTVILSMALAIMVVRLRLFSFRTQRPSEYRGLGPQFDLVRHLGRRNLCEGVIFGPTGRVTSRFHAWMSGTWEGSEGSLELAFHYDSGATQTRLWRLSLDDGGRFTARADDVVGIGRGRVEGPTVRSRYRIVLPEEGGGHTLDVVDWMYLTERGTIVNRTQFYKYGVKVAELVATIREVD